MTRGKWEAEIRLSSNPETADQFALEEDDPDRKLVIGVLADFGDPAAAEGMHRDAALEKRRCHDIDRDNFDEVLSRFNVRWRGNLAGVPGGAASPPVELVFGELEDFHPDRIVRRIPVLRSLHDLLPALEDPSRFAQAAAAIAQWHPAGAGRQPESPRAPEASASPAGQADGARLLDAILGQPGAARPQASDVDRLVREIVAPYLVRVDTRQQEELTEALHRALSGQVSGVLHDPAFQSLESLWRSLRLLVDAAGSDTRVRIVQVRKDELLRDVTSGKTIEASGLAGLLVDAASVPGAEKFSLLVCGFEFCHDLEDLALLERLGNIGAALKAPFLTAAGPQLFGCRSFSELPAADEIEKLFEGSDYHAWRMLRQGRAARWLACAMPRLLCRLPYGPNTDPAETFMFEEQLEPGEHEKLVWGNPAFAVAAIFAGAFAREGWQMNPAASVARLEGLPLYVREKDGASCAQPCAEMLLSERAVETLTGLGLLPLVSYRDADIVSFPTLQTLALPQAPLRL